MTICLDNGCLSSGRGTPDELHQLHIFHKFTEFSVKGGWLHQFHIFHLFFVVEEWLSAKHGAVKVICQYWFEVN